MGFTFQDFKIFIISTLFFLLAEIIWNTISLYFVLKIFKIINKIKELLHSLKFYYYIGGAAIFSLIVDRGFKLVLDSDFFKNFFGTNSIFIFMMISIIFLMIIHFYFCYLILDLDGKKSLKLALILGFLTAPWPTFISNL